MKITIITATLNNENTIKDCLYSIVNQTYKNIEHIIIDGKSNDKTLKIINKFGNKISKIISEKDSGIYDALNKGIKNASGNIIGFLHADDIYQDNDIIKKVINLFQTEKVDSVFGDLQYVRKENLNKVIRNWKAGNFTYSKLKRGWMPPHPTFFVKKEIYEKYGFFDINYKISGDYEMILRLLGKYKISTSYLPEVIIKMRTGGESNKNFKNIILKMQEDKKALKRNKIGNLHTVIMKNIRKISQFYIS